MYIFLPENLNNVVIGLPKFITEKELKEGIKKFADPEEMVDTFCKCDCSELLDLRGLLIYMSLRDGEMPAILAGLASFASKRCGCEYTDEEIASSAAKWATKFELGGLGSRLMELGLSQEDVVNLFERIEDRMYNEKYNAVMERIRLEREVARRLIPPGIYI